MAKCVGHFEPGAREGEVPYPRRASSTRTRMMSATIVP
jgi:hypothetical protein